MRSTGLLAVATALITFAHCAINPATIIPNHCDDIQPRLEIRELARNDDQFTVFLLALKRVKETNATDPTSYYKIAGKH